MSKRDPPTLPYLAENKGLPGIINLTTGDIGFPNIAEEDSKADKNADMQQYPEGAFQPLSLKNLNIDLNYDPAANNEDLKAISRRLNCLLGHELLYFEFIENLFLYLLVTVVSS